MANIGRLNRLHTHDLPQTFRGLVFDQLVGHHPMFVEGISFEGFLPCFGESILTFTAEAFDGGVTHLLEGDADADKEAFALNLDWFTMIGDESQLNISLIGMYGMNDPEGRYPGQLFSLDFMYKWQPLKMSAWKSFVVGMQLFYDAREEAGPPVATDRAAGYYLYAQYQVAQRTYVGVRYDWTEHLEDRTIESKRVVPYVSYYVSEFLRFRISAEMTSSDDPGLDDLKTFLLEINVVFGAHPPHPYWVNF
jgi:hypothetical protein